jgi:VWA domain-containing protein/aerotolerance regulator-like protein
MFFLNLTAGEFFGLLAALGGAITALYLLDRTKRRKIVSTLRFWVDANRVQDQRSRKRMREPWSLVLQLLGLLLLLAAAAQLQWGSREARGRDHVLLIDTSAWSGQRVGPESLLDREKSLAAAYLRALPAKDRVMLVSADSLATPLTPFTLDRASLLRALGGCAAGYSALNLPQAVSFARQALSWAGGRAGEIVYAGPRLVSGEQTTAPEVSNLRILDARPDRENAGIRRLAVRRSEDDPDSWQATIAVRNYGARPRRLRLQTQFAGTAFAPRPLLLSPGEETTVEYNFSTNTAGELRAELFPHDNLESDDRASLRLPTSGALRVAVFTQRADALRPLLEANHRLSVKFYPTSVYVPDPHADVVVLDRFAPIAAPKPAALWIEPPRGRSPVPIKSVVENATIKSWHADAALEAGLRSKETRIANAEIFETFEGDTAIASAAEGAVVVVRPKTAVIGFDPLEGDLKFEIATPLLFADLLRWLSPEAFRLLELSAGQVGAASVPLDAREVSEGIRIIDQRGFAIPFTVRAQMLELFTSHPSVVRILSNDRERVLSLTLPDVAESEWTPPGRWAHGLPVPISVAPAAVDLWKWLALAGAGCLLTEWLRYGRRRISRFQTPLRMTA